MGACGGSIGVARITFKDTFTPLQVAGADDGRERMTIRADRSNVAAVWLTTNQSSSWREGFYLDPGESYTFDGRGARAALYVIATGASGKENVMILTEGA